MATTQFRRDVMIGIASILLITATIAARDEEAVHNHHSDEAMDYFQYLAVEDTPAPATPRPIIIPSTPMPHVTPTLTTKPKLIGKSPATPLTSGGSKNVVKPLSTLAPAATLKRSDSTQAKLRRAANAAAATAAPATPAPPTPVPTTPAPTPQPTPSAPLPGNCNMYGSFSTVGDIFGWPTFAANQCPPADACLSAFCSCLGGTVSNSTGTPTCVNTSNDTATALSCARQRTQCLMQPLPLNATAVRGCSLQITLGVMAGLASSARSPCIASGEALPLIDLSQMMTQFNSSTVNYSNAIIQQFTAYWSSVNGLAWNTSYLANSSVVDSLSRFIETKINKTFGGVNPYVMTLGCMANLCPFLYRTTGSNYSAADLLSACNMTLPPVCPPTPPATTLPPGVVKQVEAVQLRITGNQWGGLLTTNYSAVESMVKYFLALTLNVDLSVIIVYGLKSGSLLVDFGVNQQSTNLTNVAQAVQSADLTSVQSFYTATTGSNEVLTSTATVTTVTVGGTPVVASDKCGATCVGLAVMGGIIGVAIIGLLAACVYKRCCRRHSAGEGQKIIEEHFPEIRESGLNQQGIDYHSTQLEPVFEQNTHRPVMMSTVTPTAAAFKTPNAV